jgi:cell division protein FtsQ
LQSSNLMRNEGDMKNLRKAWRRKIVFVFFLFIGFVIVLESPLTRVRKFEVSGNTTIPEQTLIKVSHLYTGMSLWQVNARAINAAVRGKEPYVQGVDVKTDYYTGTVSLRVHEKQVVAIFESSGKFYDVLNDGTIYSTVKPATGFARPIITADKPSVVHTGQVAQNPFVATVARQLSELPVSDTENISEIHICCTVFVRKPSEHDAECRRCDSVFS